MPRGRNVAWNTHVDFFAAVWASRSAIIDLAATLWTFDFVQWSIHRFVMRLLGLRDVSKTVLRWRSVGLLAVRQQFSTVCTSRAIDFMGDRAKATHLVCKVHRKLYERLRIQITTASVSINKKENEGATMYRPLSCLALGLLITIGCDQNEEPLATTPVDDGEIVAVDEVIVAGEVADAPSVDTSTNDKNPTNNNTSANSNTVNREMVANEGDVVEELPADEISGSNDENTNNEDVINAVAEMVAIGDSGVTGTVRFTQREDKVEVRGEITGLEPGKHGFHVHEKGDLSDKKEGKSAGGHFDPTDQPHGRPSDEERHVGDLGNIVADENGKATINIDDDVISLRGENSILGRSLMVHAKADEFTQPTGDAGGRVSFGLIEKK